MQAKTSARDGHARRRGLLRSVLGMVLFLGAGALALYAWRPEMLLDAEFARQALSADMTKHEVVVDDHRWKVLERRATAGGGASDPWVFVHGFTGSRENWLPMLADFSAAAPMLVPDLPGWGESTRLEQADYGILAQVDRLRQFLDTRRIARAHLVGHSMGGHIAGVFAARHPGRVASLTLIDSAGVMFEPNAFALSVQRGETPFNFSSRAEFDQIMSKLFTEPPYLPPRFKDVLIARNVASHAFHTRVLAAISKGEAAFELERNLGRIQASTLVIWCRDDRVLDVSSVRAFARMSFKPTVTLLDDCGHMAMMERPAEVANALRAHMVRVQ